MDLENNLKYFKITPEAHSELSKHLQRGFFAKIPKYVNYF